jgi:hypothetical protein
VTPQGAVTPFFQVSQSESIIDMQKKALLLTQDGRIEPIKPANGKNFTLSELKKLIGCDWGIEVIYLNNSGQENDPIMIGDDEARLVSEPVVNPIATKVYQESWNTRNDIVGNIVLCTSAMFQ